MLAQNRFLNKSVLFLLFSFVIIVLFFAAYKPANKILSNQIPAFVNVNQPKFVFFDLGLNNGDSLLDFFGFRSQGLLQHINYLSQMNAIYNLFNLIKALLEAQYLMRDSAQRLK